MISVEIRERQPLLLRFAHTNKGTKCMFSQNSGDTGLLASTFEISRCLVTSPYPAKLLSSPVGHPVCISHD